MQVNCTLRVIDREVTLSERVEAWKRVGGTEEEVESLRTRAALFLRTPQSVPRAAIETLNLDDLEVWAHAGVTALR